MLRANRQPVCGNSGLSLDVMEKVKKLMEKGPHGITKRKESGSVWEETFTSKSRLGQSMVKNQSLMTPDKKRDSQTSFSLKAKQIGESPSIVKDQVRNKLNNTRFTFDNDDDKADFENSLCSNFVIRKFIESAFNGNTLILPPINASKAESRLPTTAYISGLNVNKPEIMKKIHKVSYAEIFSERFDPSKIDANLKEMELDEKLGLLDNIIDYLYYNFRLLREDSREIP